MITAVSERLGCHPDSLLSVPRNISSSRVIRRRIIVHVDMDCFFASVAVRDNPHLRGKPVVVCHAAGANQPRVSAMCGGEVSCATYEARAFGIRAGMFFGEAQRLCPDLVSVPYDFASYEAVSVVLYSLFYGTGAVVQAKSVDEAFLDLTHTSAAAGNKNGRGTQDGVDELVQQLRENIFKQTGCRCSAGIGSCPLIARLSTSRAKPNGQLRVLQADESEFVLGVAVRGLPGIGYVQSKKLSDLAIKTCADLRAVPLSVLQSSFGDQTGQSFYDVCRGIDSRVVEPLQPRKSIGAEASWGVRFHHEEESKVIKFVKDMAREVAERCRAANATGRKVTFKIYKMKPKAGRPGKHLGHGPCDILTKSGRVEPCSVEDFPSALASACLLMHSTFNVPPPLIRGLGVQATDLTFHSLNSKGRLSSIGRIDNFFLKTAGSLPDASVSVHQLGEMRDHEPASGGDDDNTGKGSGDDKMADHHNSPRDLNDAAMPPSEKRICMRRQASQLDDVGMDNETQPVRKSRRQRIESSDIELFPQGGWDMEVFLELPKHMQEELVGEQTANQGVRGNPGVDDSDRACIETSDVRAEDTVGGFRVDRNNPGPATSSRPDNPPSLEKQRELPLPEGWDRYVFMALPHQIQQELLLVSHASADLAAAGSYRRGSELAGQEVEYKTTAVVATATASNAGANRNHSDADRQHTTAAESVAASFGAWDKRGAKRAGQVTMTQMAAISQLKRVGQSIVSAEEFRKRGIGECMELLVDLSRRQPTANICRPVSPGVGCDNVAVDDDDDDDDEIPPPPSLSSNESQDRGEQDVAGVDASPPSEELQSTQVLIEQTSRGERVFADEGLASYAGSLKTWMVSNRDSVRSAHLELLRGRLLEIMQRCELERLFAEMTTIRVFAAAAGGGWIAGFNSILRDVQIEVRSVVAVPLMISVLPEPSPDHCDKNTGNL
jgi:nucleotidyltransferase/DNA polymerase involved in DNA repair